MWKSVSAAFLAIAACGASLAQPAGFEQGMNTMWEALWHQSGVPTRLVRWEQEMRVRMTGVNLAAHKAPTLQALQEVASVAGVRLVDVSHRPDAAQLANVHIQVVPDTALSANQPCETRLDFYSEDRITSASMLMRNADVRRCASHEAMHLMGVRGHPQGQTVLSYFTDQHAGLQPLDRAMLRAWYSPRTRGGMTPFEVLPILADELVAIMPDRAAAQKARDRFLARTVQEMQAFASGSGDVPMVLKASGKASPEGIRLGRMEMSYFLGVAYQGGASVPRDPAQAAHWLQRAASLGSRSALARLGAAGR